MQGMNGEIVSNEWFRNEFYKLEMKKIDDFIIKERQFRANNQCDRTDTVWPV